MAPVYHGQWSYDMDKLYVKSSSGYVHPRASHSELEEIFSTPLGARRGRPDNPDHWYEAQLLHFGLPPSKYQATAKMRLMETFQEGRLDVPEEILRIEDTLSRDWTKQDLEARILGPSMRPSVARDTTIQYSAQRPPGGWHPNLFSGALAQRAAEQGNSGHLQHGTQPFVGWHGNRFSEALARGAGGQGSVGFPHNDVQPSVGWHGNRLSAALGEEVGRQSNVGPPQNNIQPSGIGHANISSAALAGGAGGQSNMRSHRNDLQPPHGRTKKRKGNNGEPSTLPMKSVRFLDEIDEHDLQVQVHINPNGETPQHMSTVIPESVGYGRGNPAPGRYLQQVGYQTVPLSYQGTYGTATQLPPPKLMDVDGANDYCGYGYNSAMRSRQSEWSFLNRDSVTKV